MDSWSHLTDQGPSAGQGMAPSRFGKGKFGRGGVEGRKNRDAVSLLGENGTEGGLKGLSCGTCSLLLLPAFWAEPSLIFFNSVIHDSATFLLKGPTSTRFSPPTGLSMVNTILEQPSPGFIPGLGHRIIPDGAVLDRPAIFFAHPGIGYRVLGQDENSLASSRENGGTHHTANAHDPADDTDQRYRL